MGYPFCTSDNIICHLFNCVAVPVDQSDIILIFVVSAVVVLSLSLVIILFVVFYQRRVIRQNEEIQKMEQERQEALLDASIQTQEVERKRIAKDLHDEIGAMLSIIKLQLGQTIRNTEEGKGQASAVAAKSLVEETIGNVRTIARDLLPATLENFGLFVALEELTSRVNASGLIKICLEASASLKRFDLKKELAIYRIAQELVNNSIKHADAQQIKIEVTVEESRLRFAFSDNGKGLHPNQLGEHTGLGLRNIDSRVKVINGTSIITTSPGKGFKMQLVVEI